MSPAAKEAQRRLYQQEREQAKGALRALEVPDGPWLVRMKGTRRMTHRVRPGALPGAVNTVCRMENNPALRMREYVRMAEIPDGAAVCKICLPVEPEPVQLTPDQLESLRAQEELEALLYDEPPIDLRPQAPPQYPLTVT